MYKKIKSRLAIFSYKYVLLLLLLVPLTTEYLELGHFPENLRGWTTEIVMTIIIGTIILAIYRQYSLLEKLSVLDHLTGIGNRRQFEIDLNREILRTKRMKTGLGLIFFDLDGFKEINDRYGHKTGDNVLVQFARGLSDFVRKGSDYCYRFGGDEFAVLLTGMKNKEINKTESQIEDQLTKKVFSKLPEGVSVSNGFVLLKAGETYNELLKRADEAMYQAKYNKKYAYRSSHP
ncbi:MAG: GGDEF domain-containing protein [Elusimicrobia bacterium]|nr:GGDEF domain-containing protein [Elusimicrobiota bacterium]